MRWIERMDGDESNFIPTLPNNSRFTNLTSHRLSISSYFNADNKA